MPRKKKQSPQVLTNGLQQYVKLENRLVLLAWLNSLLGYRSNRELLEDCKGVDEGFGADGRSFLYHHLIARGRQVKITADGLARYDENIRRHLESINRGCTEKITLRYFQHLAALYTEIVLDCLFHAKAQQGLYEQENAGMPRIHFDRHLYQPLLLDMPEKAQIVPPGLKGSEVRFVRDLREYWNAEKDKSLAGKEVFLLRNLSRGYGIGFFEERGFYPDFILWVVDQNSGAQQIVFIELHGMLHAKAYIHDEKARLHERLPELAREIGKRSRRTDVSLDAFIISATPYDDLYHRKLPSVHPGEILVVYV